MKPYVFYKRVLFGRHSTQLGFFFFPSYGRFHPEDIQWEGEDPGISRHGVVVDQDMAWVDPLGVMVLPQEEEVGD